jgi:hypothetical protein
MTCGCNGVDHRTLIKPCGCACHKEIVYTGGPAFPSPCSGGFHRDTGGATLRDYFAAKAIEGFVTSAIEHYYASGGAVATLSGDEITRAAREAYRFADAMLKAREAPAKA